MCSDGNILKDVQYGWNHTGKGNGEDDYDCYMDLYSEATIWVQLQVWTQADEVLSCTASTLLG